MLAVGLGAAARLAAQEPPQVTVARLAAVEAAVVRVAAAHPDAIWPGFRPDTVPVLYVVPGAGVLLLNWPSAAPPDGFAPLAGQAHAGWQPVAVRTAASTGTTLAGRNAAQVLVFPDAGDALLFGTTVHEAFHVFERAHARQGRRFGSGENSFLVSSYPVFDAANGAGVALEGRLLARALAAKSRADLVAATQEFVAAREARHRALGSDYADFEAMGELNEGLAEYALVRVLALAAGDTALPWRAEAGRQVDAAALTRGAQEAVARLRALRRSQVDSVLGRPGLRVVLRADSLPNRSFGLCGIDPQNLLQVDAGVLLHTRWVRPCAAGLSVEFTTAAVQDRDAGTFTAVVGTADSVRVTVGGRPVALRDGEALAAATDVRVESPGLTLQATRVDLALRGQVLEIRPLRP